MRFVKYMKLAIFLSCCFIQTLKLANNNRNLLTNTPLANHKLF